MLWPGAPPQPPVLLIPSMYSSMAIPHGSTQLNLVGMHSPYRVSLEYLVLIAKRACVSGPHETETIRKIVLAGYHSQGTMVTAD